MSPDEDEQLAIERHNKLLEKARSVRHTYGPIVWQPVQP